MWVFSSSQSSITCTARPYYPPFTWMMKLTEGRNPTLILLVIIINSSMVITEFLLGMLLVGPVILIIQGFMVGALTAQADSKTQVFSVLC
jgi:hypothetical protein